MTRIYLYVVYVEKGTTQRGRRLHLRSYMEAVRTAYSLHLCHLDNFLLMNTS